MDPITLVLLVGLTDRRVEEQEIVIFTRIIEQEFGEPYGHRRPKENSVKKVILIEHNLVYLWRQGDIITPVLLQDETSRDGVTRFLRPGRRFQVNDPLAFNQSFRRLQSEHEDWPGRKDHKTTTPVTQILDALGIEGEGVGASPHAIRQGDIRGSHDTDPRESSGDRKRDGLYYRAYVHNPERARKEINAKRLFHEPALPARVSSPPSAPAGDREHPGPLVEDTRAAKRARSAVPRAEERSPDVTGEAAMEASLYSSTNNEVPSPPFSGPSPDEARGNWGVPSSLDGDVSDVDAETSSPESFSENGTHMDPPVPPQDDLVQVDSFFADENHTDSSMPFPPSDDSFADDSFPHDETQTGMDLDTVEAEDGEGMDLDTALEAVAVEDPWISVHMKVTAPLLDSPGLSEDVTA
jgi:hypothetical protein